MIEVGMYCKINFDERIYQIIDIREINKTISLNENTTRQLIDFRLDLKDVEDLDRIVTDISITNISMQK